MFRQEFSQNKVDPEEEARRKKEEEIVKSVSLSAILDSSAVARLNTIKLAKPDKAARVEQMLLRMCGGMMGRKISEQQLIEILERDDGSSKTKTTVKFDRRRAALDDSDEEY